MTIHALTATALAALALSMTEPTWAQQAPTAPGAAQQAPTAPGAAPQAPTAPGAAPQAPTAPGAAPQAPTAPGAAPQAPMAPGAARSAPMAPAQSTLKSDDRDFLENAAQAGHLEIEGSKLALQKSHNQAVKSFAQRMLDDHGKVAKELAALAAQKNYKLPDEPSVLQRAKLKMLDVRDESFDKAYVDQIGVSAHEDAVKLFEDAAKDVHDADVKAFAAKTLPILKSHLQAAQSLKQQIAPAK